jgi:hypothetical protein
MTVIQLRAVAKSLGITGLYKMRKAELLSAIAEKRRYHATLGALQPFTATADASIGCPGMYVHRFHEDQDTTTCYPLSLDVINAIQARGWIVKEKIGEGSVSDVFLVTSRRNGQQAVLLLFGNLGLDESSGSIGAKLRVAKKFPTIFPLIYDSFTLRTPYSSTRAYLQTSNNFQNRTIQVIERLTPMNRVLQSSSNSISPSLISHTLTAYLTTLYNNGITYSDLKADNIGFTKQGKLKLLDIEGMHLRREPNFNVNESVDNFIKYELQA